VGLLIMTHRKSSPLSLFFRTITLGLSGTTAFALFEAWPRTLPRWLQRWALQVIAVGVAMPATTILFYLFTAPPGARPSWQSNDWLALTLLALLVAPWTALVAIVRQKEAFVRHQELAFALERSELERQALDARLHLLQAQVAPHFLFNTLAN